VDPSSAQRPAWLGWAQFTALLVCIATGINLIVARERSGGQRDAPFHVVICLIDTLRLDRLGVYGYDLDTSPNIDALAREAFVFENAVATGPWTLPSVVSMMTSTFPVDHQVVVRGQTIGGGLVPLAVRMARLGYRTASFVTNPLAAHASGLDVGYEHLERHNKRIAPERVDRWLGEVAGEPVFLYLHSTEPHRPYYPPPHLKDRVGRSGKLGREWLNAILRRYRNLTRVDFEAKRPLGTTDNTAEQEAILAELGQAAESTRVLYDASVAWADENFGKLVEVLKRRGILDRSLFLLVSDHGEEFLEHGQIMHGQSVYAELVRVPMIWRLPDREGGVRVSHPANLVDVAPTILDFLGHGADGEFVGRSLLPAIAAPAAPVASPAAGAAVTSVRINRIHFFAPAVERRGQVNLRIEQGPWRGIWNVEPNSFELFDVRSDPQEARDVAALHPEIAEGLRADAEHWLATRPDLGIGAPRGSSPDLEKLDDDTVEQLRALGYLN
jgi:arylsulfatase A-like enzyme